MCKQLWHLQPSWRKALNKCENLRATGESKSLLKARMDADTHVKELTGRIEEAIAAGKTVLIPTAQEADLPLEPIRGTPFEKLMVATLQNISMVGVYALHAEPGAGKSTAATLAALELKGRQPKDVIVVLQNDFERQLESFFCLSNIKFTAEIARPFLAMLREKGIRLRLILDNVLDSSTMSGQTGDRLRVLARAANDNLHQVIVIVQSEAVANDIAGLNGDTTQKGEQMPAVWCRWSREETLELLNRTSDIQELLEKQLGKDREQREAEERNVLLTEALELALERSQIPDKYGCWRPRSTIRYIMTGNRPTAPTAPLPIPGGATGSFSYISFSKSSKKRYLMNSLINLQSRLATLNDLITARNYCATAILFHATCRH